MGHTLHPGRPRGGWAVPLAAGFVAVAALALGPTCLADGLSDVQKQQVQVDMTILAKLQAYSLEQQFKMVYGLVAKANERDRDRNRKYAEQLLAKAEELRTRNDAGSQEYLKAARAHKLVSDVNHKIAKAFEENDQQKMDDGIVELDAALQQAGKVTGKPVARDWFTPAEAENYAMAEITKRRQAAQNPQQRVQK